MHYPIESVRCLIYPDSRNISASLREYERCMCETGGWDGPSCADFTTTPVPFRARTTTSTTTTRPFVSITFSTGDEFLLPSADAFPEDVGDDAGSGLGDAGVAWLWTCLTLLTTIILLTVMYIIIRDMLRRSRGQQARWRSAAMRGAESDPEGGLTTPEAPLHSDAPPPYSSVQLDAPPPYEKICKLGEPQQKPASSSCDV